MGLLDQLSSGLLGGTDPTAQLGLSILAGNTYSPVRQPFGSIVGRGVLGAQQQQTELQKQQFLRQQMELEKIRVAIEQQRMGLYQNAMQGDQAAPQGPAQQAVQQAADPSAPQQAPQQLPGLGAGYGGGGGAGGQGAAPPGLNFGAVPQSEIAGIRPQGINYGPQFASANALLNGGDGLAASKAYQAAQIEQARRNHAQELQSLTYASKYDKASGLPNARQAYDYAVANGGLSQKEPFSDASARNAFAFIRDQKAASLEQPAEGPQSQAQTIYGANGLIMQKDQSGNLKTVKAEEDLKQVVDPNTGKPVWVTASKAAGMQPFNASLYGAANVSDQALQFAADTYRTTGKFPAAFGRNPAMQAKVLDKVAADAAANGDTAGAIAARAAGLKANGQALDSITKRETATKAYYGTLDRNLDNLVSASKDVDSTGSPLVNRAVRAWQQGITNDPATAKMVVWLNAVQGEYAKIKSGSLGNAGSSVSAMDDAKKVINQNFSTGGIEAVAEAMRGEGKNTLDSIAQEKASVSSALSTAPNQPGGDLPTLTPEQAKASPPGTRFKTTDGRILVTH
jgi:hypothetical protein